MVRKKMKINQPTFNFNYILLFFIILQVDLTYAEIFTERMKRPDTAFLQKSIINLISPSNLKTEMSKFLAFTYPGRFYSSPGHSKIPLWFEQFQKENDVSFETQIFTPNVEWAYINIKKEFNQKIAKSYPTNSPIYQKWFRFIKNIEVELSGLKNKKFKNYIWKKEGSDNQKTLVISANLDSIGQDPESRLLIHQGDFFGANDNASGFIASLELVKILSKITLPFNVMVVFFDLQEFGNLGSYSFVTEYLKKNQNRSFYHINSLMLSKLNGSKNSMHFDVFSRDDNSTLHQLLKGAKNLVPEAKVNFVNQPYVSSDTGPFLDFDILSLTIVGLNDQERNKITHKISDSIESIDFYGYHLGTKLLFSLVLSYLYPLP